MKNKLWDMSAKDLMEYIEKNNIRFSYEIYQELKAILIEIIQESEND